MPMSGTQLGNIPKLKLQGVCCSALTEIAVCCFIVSLMTHLTVRVNNYPMYACVYLFYTLAIILICTHSSRKKWFDT